jgi:hypothetical protein
MVEKTIKTINGKLKVAIPADLSEVTLGQMIALQEKPGLNDLEAISILSGIAIEQLQNVLRFDELLVFGETILSLSTQIGYLYNSDAIPKSILFKLTDGDKTVQVMHNLSVEPAGAFMAAREIIADEINLHIKINGPENWQTGFNPSLNACCQVLAHYFYCRATGKAYNEYEAENFCAEIKKLRVSEALPIAKHFFTCYPALSKKKTNFFLRHLRHWRKRLGSNRSKNSNISIP